MTPETSDAPLAQDTAAVCAQMPPEFAAALVAARGEIKNPRVDSNNPHFHSRYTSLAGVIDSVAPILFKHGMCAWQEMVTEVLLDSQGREFCNVLCTTVILHQSGAMLRFPAFKLPAAQASAQGVGGSVTYARRYSLMPALGIAAEDDDDGEADRQARESRSAPPARNPSTQTTARRPVEQSSGTPLPPRPTGAFGYGKKYVDVPWNVLFTSQLEWFRDQATTPKHVRDKCIAELAHRQAEADALESAQARKAQDDAAIPIDDNIPM